jgi:hypothetical protein
MTFVTHSELEEIHAAMKLLISERKTLASHCVVVIYEPGLQLDVQWCTVCGARMASLRLPFKHKEECLVEKVMKEA